MQAIDTIRIHIDEVLAASDSRAKAEARILEFNDQLSDEQIADFLDHLEAFVRGTPDLIEAAADEANAHDQFDAVDEVLDTALNYFLDADDVIPDHLGLYGLLDDAYLAQKYLLTMSEQHQERFGEPLLGEQLRPAVDVVRQWIGEDDAATLDAKVEQQVASFPWAGALVLGALGIGAALLVKGLFSGGGGGGSWGSSYEAQVAQFGAENGVSLNPYG